MPQRLDFGKPCSHEGFSDGGGSHQLALYRKGQGTRLAPEIKDVTGTFQGAPDLLKRVGRRGYAGPEGHGGERVHPVVAAREDRVQRIPGKRAKLLSSSGKGPAVATASG